MKLDSSLYLKWMAADHPSVAGLNFFTTGQCGLAAKNTHNEITGLTIFEPRDLNEKFVEKLKLRAARPEFVSSSFILYAPLFLKHRVEKLFTDSKQMRTEIRFTSYLNVLQANNRFSVRDRLRVINVDDSPVLLKLLKHTLTDFGFVDVVAQVSDSRLAVETILKLKPDVITMDIQMPNKTGVDVVRELLSKEYYNIIMISSLSMDEGSMVFDALNSGAFDYLQKPTHEDRKDFQEELLVKLMLAVEGKKTQADLRRSQSANKTAKSTSSSVSAANNILWCIGASTGGTQALTQVFTSMPTEIPATLVVQHIPPVFSKSFANSLQSLCPFNVKEAEHNEEVKFNHVYIAPGGMQMGIENRMGKSFISLSDSEPVNRFKPSVDYMFRSVSKIKGYNIVAGILTGMGRDGSEGLLQLKKQGVKTFAQDEASCAVFGMPRAAIELGAVDTVVPLEEVAQTLLSKSSSFKKVA